ncbi:hypothetical protein C9374_012299 [Naegleria lovaniensis]|uniref:THH1/TOM1/TOM3 domain-containing protein n=1 Tax=Naegleria lovaniensis TaxID=51637 RepID=A0AA88KBU4_NAELO|nr:uncharacterized protein C9374_012299 [Naegleria lovaniensis]KAG2373310.1 hypothetical protein C9374_012299 [Naegleria lovaniensis]
MTIPIPNVIVYSTLSGIYGLIGITSLALLLRIIYVEFQQRRKFSKFISQRFGRVRYTGNSSSSSNHHHQHNHEQQFEENDDHPTTTNKKSSKFTKWDERNLKENNTRTVDEPVKHISNLESNHAVLESNLEKIDENERLDNSLKDHQHDTSSGEEEIGSRMTSSGGHHNNDSSTTIHISSSSSFKKPESTFSDKRLMFALIVILSLVRCTQLAVQASLPDFSEYRELLILVSSFPGYVYSSLMLMLVFFWTEMTILSIRKQPLLSEISETNQEEATGLLESEHSSEYHQQNSEVIRKKTIRTILNYLTASSFLKTLFFVVNFIMYMTMLVNDSLLLFQFSGDDPRGSDNNDYTNPSPYSAIEIVAVSVPTVLFIICALLVIILGITLFRRHLKNYRASSSRNIVSLYTIIYVSVVTLTDFIVLLGRAGLLIAQMFLSWLETKWQTILCYYSLGEIIPLLVLNYALYKMGTLSMLHSATTVHTHHSNDDAKFQDVITTGKNAKTPTLKKTSQKLISYMSEKAQNYYSHWDESTEEVDFQHPHDPQRPHHHDYNKYDDDNGTEKDMEGETSASDSPSAATSSTTHSRKNYGSVSEIQKFPSQHPHAHTTSTKHAKRKGTHSNTSSSSHTHSSHKNKVCSIPSPSHSLIQKVHNAHAGNVSLKNAYHEFTGIASDDE